MGAYAILIMEINFGSYANVYKHGMLCELDQRTQSTPQQKDRLQPSETLCFRAL